MVRLPNQCLFAEGEVRTLPRNDQVEFSRMTGKRYEGIFIAEGRCVKNWFGLGALGNV